METPNKKFVPILIILIVLIVGGIFALIWFWKKDQGWQVVVLYFFIALLFFFVIGLIIGAVWWLFSTQKSDMIHIHKQRIISSCRMNSPNFKQLLMFRGSDELEGRVIGNVEGIAMTKSNPITFNKETRKKLKENKLTDKQIKEFSKPKDLYWIAFKRGFMSGVELFCGIKADFTHLSGSIIYLNGMAFSPPLYDIYFLAQRWQETELIDETITFSIRRYVLQDFLKEEMNIFNDVLAISPQHQKSLEQSRLSSIQRDISPPQQPPAK